VEVAKERGIRGENARAGRYDLRGKGYEEQEVCGRSFQRHEKRNVLRQQRSKGWTTKAVANRRYKRPKARKTRLAIWRKKPSGLLGI